MWAPGLLPAGVFCEWLGPGYPATPVWLSPFFSSFFMSRSFSTLWGSLSHSCMRTKGSRPFKLSLCQGLGLDSRSDTEPCVSPRMLSPNNRCPGDRAEGKCHPRPSTETHSQESQRSGPGRWSQDSVCTRDWGGPALDRNTENSSLSIPREHPSKLPADTLSCCILLPTSLWIP